MKDINKIAYPSSGNDIYINPPHDINAWLKALRYIYAYINKGMDETKAFDTITNGWDNMNKQDFKNWKKYYESGSGTAYKKAELSKNAQYFPAGFLDSNDLRSILPGNQAQFADEEQENPVIVNKQTEKQKAEEKERLEKEQIAQQIKALIGRLNSAERIATTEGIAKALGPSFENWVRALHELKKEIQVAPFRTTKSSLMTDLIVRKGNQLYASGDVKSAKVMYKLAQVAPPPLEDTNIDIKEPSPPANDAPIETPSSSIVENHLDNNEDDAWVSEFLNGLEGSIDDKNNIMDAKASDDLYVTEEDLKIYAQEIPNPGTDVTQAIPEPEGNKLEQALAGTTVDDVIAKLEAVSNIFKNREVPRQLGMVDIMMDQLGISSYFSELGESISKALEANQYCATRIEDILGRLKGGIEVPAENVLDLAGDKPGAAENNAIGLKNKLELEKQKDDIRKKKREETSNAQEDAQILNKQPEVNTEALNKPVNIQTPQNNGIKI